MDRIWQQLVVVDPTLADLHHIRVGEAYERVGDLFRAKEEFERAADLDPSSYLADFGLARLMETLARWDEAVVHYRVAADKGPDYVALFHSRISGIRVLQGNSEEAERSARTAIVIDPASWLGYAALASVGAMASASAH